MSYDEEENIIMGDTEDEELFEPLDEPAGFDSDYEEEDPDKDH